MIVVTGATGHWKRLVIAALLKKVPASGIVSAVQNVEKAKDINFGESNLKEGLQRIVNDLPVFAFTACAQRLRVLSASAGCDSA